MAGISISGVGSGIDINNLVDQLVAAQQQPKSRRLDNRESRLQAELSAFGLVKSALSELQSALQALDSDSLFRQRTATSGNDEVFTASAEAGTAAGSYAIEVQQLAVAQKLRSAGFADADTTVGTGTLTISNGSDSFNIEVAAGGDSLAAIRDAINGSADNGIVTAGIVNVDDGAGGTEARLVLTANETGTANGLTVTVTDDDGDDGDAAGLSRLAYDPGNAVANLVELTAAADAKVLVDNQLATRSTNTVDDVVDGVTLDLVSADPGTTYALGVSADSAAATKAVDAFVKAFNGFIEVQDNLTSFNADTQQGGLLIGDSTLRLLESGLRSALTDRANGAGDADSLAAIGITTGENGRLVVDDAALADALAADPGGIAALFGGDDGVAVRADGLLTGYLQSNGLLDSRTDSLNNRIDDISDQRLDLARRTDALRSRLLAQFTAMDQLVAQLQSTGNFLTQQLANVPVPGRDND